MIDKISPEERLFRAIQEGRKSSFDNEALKKKKISPLRKFFSGGINLRRINPVRWLLSNGAKRLFVNLRPKVLVKERSKQAGTPITFSIKFYEIDPKAVNKVLIVILIVLTIFVIHFAVNKRPNI